MNIDLCLLVGHGEMALGFSMVAVYVLSLDRTPERFASFCAINRHLTNVKRVSAVDGRCVDVECLIERGLVTTDLLQPGYFYSVGAIGAAMSHIGLWDEAIRMDTPITIAEDDAIFNHEFEREAEAMLRELPLDWDFIAWGYNFDYPVCVVAGALPILIEPDEEELRKNIDVFQAAAIAARAYRMHWAIGTPCYSISPKGAELFRERLLPLEPLAIPVPRKIKDDEVRVVMTLGIDLHLNMMHRRRSQSWLAFPPLVVTRNEAAQSTIQSGGTA
jgi:GR25 family glycosyltransferase involved in LPS biosynthesis